MAIIVNNISSPIKAEQSEVIAKALKTCGITDSDVKLSGIHKTSLDARKRAEIHFVHSVYLELHDKRLEKKLCAENDKCKGFQPSELDPVFGIERPSGRVIVAGFGPAGMFAALVLAKYGYRPLVLEMGADADKRSEIVEHFWKTGELDEKTNVQFGEGGAGTFSDGKLTTRIRDPRCRFVLESFVNFGADESVLIKAKPHIGTDVLKTVVKNIRKEIISLGGEIRFESPLKDIELINGKIRSVGIGGASACREECAALIVACGHSARDTFYMLHDRGIELEPKSFSVGARIEHTRGAVDSSLYGEFAGNPYLPSGEYQLAHHTAAGRGVYTFCMCPGGTVVAAASESGGVVTNGMSEFARNGKNSNAAVVVSVSPDDFGHGVFDGLEFARGIERAAYSAASGYAAPATTVGGFFSGAPTLKGATVEPTYQRGVAAYEFRKIFPNFVTEPLAEGLRAFSRKMKCFGDEGAILTAPETRTSSPIRIPRGEYLNSGYADNLYPCGEGAGYAGGIMSAATDGVRVALAIMKRFSAE